MTYHQLCPHTAGLHQLVVNGEYKTVFFNGYIIIQSLQSFLVRTRNNTSPWYRTCTNSDAKESLFHFQGVTVVTNQPVFILYVSTMNQWSPSNNRGFLGRPRNNTSRAWYRTCTHSGTKESVFSVSRASQSKQTSQSSSSMYQQSTCATNQTIEAFWVVLGTIRPGRGTELVKILVRRSLFFHFQCVTVETNQPVFILYVSTMNQWSPSNNRGFLGRPRNNTSRAWYRTCTHSGTKESVFSVSRASQSKQTSQSSSSMYQQSTCATNQTIEAFWVVLGTIRPGRGTELVKILVRRSLFFHFQGVTVVTNQPVFILYVSTMNLCNPSNNRGFLIRTRNNTSPGGTELVHILVRRSLFFPFPGRHSRNKPASLHPLCINNEPVQPIEQ